MNIEYEITDKGHLAKIENRNRLEDELVVCHSLEEIAKVINQIPGLAAYRGAHHVAIHPGRNGRMFNGSNRLAIITD